MWPYIIAGLVLVVAVASYGAVEFERRRNGTSSADRYGPPDAEQRTVPEILPQQGD